MKFMKKIVLATCFITIFSTITAFAFRVFLPIPPKRWNKQIISQVIPETEPVPELLHPC